MKISFSESLGDVVLSVLAHSFACHISPFDAITGNNIVSAKCVLCSCLASLFCLSCSSFSRFWKASFLQ